MSIESKKSSNFVIDSKLQAKVLAIKPEERAVIVAEGSQPPLPLVRGKNVHSDETIASWKIQLATAHPQIPLQMLDTILDAFQTHPQIFDKMMEETKENPDCYNHLIPTPEEIFPDIDCFRAEAIESKA
tara:strand:- start:347 stop:733 length:387 start_codon:yes stop_codon:yes gene_type:complete